MGCRDISGNQEVVCVKWLHHISHREKPHISECCKACADMKANLQGVLLSSASVALDCFPAMFANPRLIYRTHISEKRLPEAVLCFPPVSSAGACRVGTCGTERKSQRTTPEIGDAKSIYLSVYLSIYLYIYIYVS